MNISKGLLLFNKSLQNTPFQRSIHLSAVCNKKKAGKYKRSIKGDKPLTYEMAYPPHRIAHWKSWNSWNTYAKVSLYNLHSLHHLYTNVKDQMKKEESPGLLYRIKYTDRSREYYANLLGGLRPAETLAEDVFIRKFLQGTWHRLFLTEVIIKRQANLIRLAGIVYSSIPPRKIYFLIGYTEELLSYWLQCPVKMELETVSDKKAVIFKYV